MKCPNCRNRIVHRGPDVTRLRTEGPISFDGRGRARGRCYWCKAEVELPITLSDPEDLPGPLGEQLFVPVRTGT